MFRFLTLVVLIALAGLFGYFAWASDAQFRTGLMTNAFWTLVGIIATTFLLEALLKRDVRNRRRRDSEFAFRTFSGTALASIGRIVGLDCASAEAPLEAALQDNRRFAEAALALAAKIRAADAIDGPLYDRTYLDVGSKLRDLSMGHVRTFSRNKQEMLTHFGELQDLGQGWRYRSSLRDGAGDTVPDYLSDGEKERLVEGRRQDREEVLTLSRTTADYLVRIADVVAAGGTLGASAD
ncbi:MAG: hypothetical protein QOJ53_2137 [Sphingomonadales bacterium]|nr:hypothetical protein [Sphingomonadales bacterium]